ncbi:MAG: hypothetical protein L0196_09345 [candidate division Zixibacteria bacterium]|nr:hypothetical protein [candidate division Zixibacteria bacterium]
MPSIRFPKEIIGFFAPSLRGAGRALKRRGDMDDERRVKMEKRPGGSLLVRSSGSVRLILIFFGVTVAAGVVLQEPRSFTRILLGFVAALLPLSIAAILDGVRFEFDGLKRRLFWRRKNFFRTRSGELGFDEITDVYLGALGEADFERRKWKGKVQQVYRVVLATGSGELPLSNAWSADERAQTKIAEAVCAVLGKSAPVTKKNSFDDLVAAGQNIDAVKLARERLGLSLTEAKKLIDDRIRSKTFPPAPKKPV